MRPSDLHVSGSRLEALALRRDGQRADLVRFDLRDRAALVALPSCEISVRSTQSYGDHAFHRSLFTSAGLVVRDGIVPDATPLPTTGRLVRVSEAGCEGSRRQRADQRAGRRDRRRR